ncbi:SHOCT domain-containing protein [Microbispora catharanthi]|uniref:SHOCT domain-containing protein n=1 Tax=Microbispora catharanthi TaxID=1712871 RepID=A0A5N6BL09_9ACTN|nr:SHOCT domain-containing protein [Microbispora catharanthi]KAB8180858.1 hypothetical protein FH610_031830 [Microbispora catharanthi]
MMYWNGMNGWGYALMMVGNVLFWAAVVVGIVLLVRYVGRSSPSPMEPRLPSAEELLAQRYARGEIDSEEYRARLDMLRGSRADA